MCGQEGAAFWTKAWFEGPKYAYGEEWTEVTTSLLPNVDILVIWDELFLRRLQEATSSRSICSCLGGAQGCVSPCQRWVAPSGNKAVKITATESSGWSIKPARPCGSMRFFLPEPMRRCGSGDQPQRCQGLGACREDTLPEGSVQLRPIMYNYWWKTISASTFISNCSFESIERASVWKQLYFPVTSANPSPASLWAC